MWPVHHYSHGRILCGFPSCLSAGFAQPWLSSLVLACNWILHPINFFFSSLYPDRGQPTILIRTNNDERGGGAVTQDGLFALLLAHLVSAIGRSLDGTWRGLDELHLRNWSHKSTLNHSRRRRHHPVLVSICCSCHFSNCFDPPIDKR